MYKDVGKKFFEKIQNFSKQDYNLLSCAYDVAFRAHKGQMRKIGNDPYIVHVLAVALDLWKEYKDTSLMAAGVLHDTIEDSEEITSEFITKNFWKDIGFLVDGVTKNTSGFFSDEKNFEDKVEKWIYVGMKDIRCFLLKIADRCDNMRTLNGLWEKKQIRMAFETQSIYRPLQYILWLDTHISINKIERKFQKFLQKNNLQTPKQVKECLMGTFYENFTSEIYHIVYGKASEVLWEITDRDQFCSLVEKPVFSQCISIESLEGNGKDFSVKFRFNKGILFEDMSEKIRLKKITY